MSELKILSVVLVPDPKCKIGCNGTGTFTRMHLGIYKKTVCACCAITFISDDLEETMSALQGAITMQLEEKLHAAKDTLDKHPTQP